MIGERGRGYPVTNKDWAMNETRVDPGLLENASNIQRVREMIKSQSPVVIERSDGSQQEAKVRDWVDLDSVVVTFFDAKRNQTMEKQVPVKTLIEWQRGDASKAA